MAFGLIIIGGQHLPGFPHPEGRLPIEDRVRETAGPDADPHAPENPQRLGMAEFPAGATPIPNPSNRIPGFTVAGDRVRARHAVTGPPEQVDAAWSETGAARARMGAETGPGGAPLRGGDTPAN